MSKQQGWSSLRDTRKRILWDTAIITMIRRAGSRSIRQSLRNTWKYKISRMVAYSTRHFRDRTMGQQHVIHSDRKTNVTSDLVFRLLERQGFRCAITGRELTPDCCSLDHILAVSRGGKHDIANIQAVVPTANQAKGTMTNEEFLSLCQDVVATIGPNSKQG